MSPFPLPFIVLGLLLGACAAGPAFNIYGADATLTPQEAVRQPPRTPGHQVAWGGVIIQSSNLQDRTRLEILAYPLNGDNRPDTEARPIGRFLAEREGYLETVNYAPGRLVTVVGPVTETRRGRIGETEYEYPVVDARRIQLWQPARRYNAPQVRFGVGVGVIFDD